MKKLMFAAAAIAAGAAMAVESQIVGYETKAIDAGAWYMIGCGFEKTDGQAFDIQEFITGQSTDWEAENCATIMVPTPEGGLITYQYLGIDSDEDENVIGAWIKLGEGDPTSFPVEPGFSCWFTDPNDVTITVAGAVTPAIVGGNEKVLLADTWNMICNPFPMAVQMNGDAKFDCTGLATDWESENCATIMYPTSAGGLITYQYLGVDSDEDENVIGAWIKLGEGDPTDMTLPSGSGFWIYNPGKDGTVVWKMN